MLRPALPFPDLRPGDIILRPFGGRWGWIITVLQALVAWDFSRYSHTEMYVGDGWVISARAGGISKMLLEDALAGAKHIAVVPVPPDADHLRPAIVAAALSMEGAGYQWLAYLWIGLARAAKVFGLRALGIPLHWLERLLETNKRWICSAYMDRAWLLGGLHMFDDGRLRAAVSPGDVAHVGWTLHADTGPWIEDGTGVD
jgi:hypothetical protein